MAPIIQGGSFFRIFDHIIYGTYERGLVIHQFSVFFQTETMVITIHFGNCVGKYSPWYSIIPYLLCGDRPAAARRCACFSIVCFID